MKKEITDEQKMAFTLASKAYELSLDIEHYIEPPNTTWIETLSVAKQLLKIACYKMNNEKGYLYDRVDEIAWTEGRIRQKDLINIYVDAMQNDYL